MSDPVAPSAPRPTYWWIQYLRGLAAAGVVIFHVYENAPLPLDRSFKIGAHGVDVFFVISGFIMYSAARDERLVQFVSRRLIRVFPLYWVATAVTVAAFFGYLGVRPSGTETVLSLALIPHYNEAHRAEIWPVLVPGWTLMYEMLFYGLFALGIAARRVVAVPTVAIIGLVVLGGIFDPRLAPLVVATNPILIEFLLGLWIAVIVHRHPGLLPGVVVATIAVSVGGIALGSDRTALFAGAAAIVATALWFERRRPGQPLASLRLLGDASYSLYLFHTPFLVMLYWLVLPLLPAPTPLAAEIYAITAIAAALGVGVLLHLTIEKPMLRVLNGWNRRLLMPAPAAAAVPS